MTRHLVAVCVALAAIVPLVLSANVPRYSEWSAPENLGGVINSGSNDASPAISKDGRSLYFQSTRPGGFGAVDLYVARRDRSDLPWGRPMNLGPVINTEFGELTPALSRDGHFLFFASPRASGSTVTIDILVSYREHVHDDFAWGTPVTLGGALNTSAFHETAPSFFENDDSGLPQLYFNSQRFDGIGMHDIYMTEMLAAGGFGAAVLVPELSSPFQDATPEISRNGLEMFFASDRPNGVGGVDLWTSVRASVLAPWSPPQNLGFAVNSSSVDWDPSISSDGLTLYFSSTRSGGMGGLDIYMARRVRR